MLNHKLYPEICGKNKRRYNVYFGFAPVLFYHRGDYTRLVLLHAILNTLQN